LARESVRYWKLVKRIPEKSMGGIVTWVWAVRGGADADRMRRAATGATRQKRERVIACRVREE
jgi:hypothetical protein